MFYNKKSDKVGKKLVWNFFCRSNFVISLVIYRGWPNQCTDINLIENMWDKRFIKAIFNF